ncbi:GNAT family N-acetyltransferase [Alloiococcus sp. CFN-8]|uniref:GNAT family N-acetyltransferase n=1 Tax=Alloiococcus sp. CFN-8 TaxID=3416081 RepID=UPI003CE838EA
MIIRDIEFDDADAFWEMQFALDKETSFMNYEPNERIKTNKINNLIKNAVEGKDLFLAAQEDNRIIGFISAQRGVSNRTKHSAYIAIGIRKDFQGRGIGTELFERLDFWARENNITRLELMVVCSNSIAKHLYEKSGFIIEGIRKNAMVVDGKYVDEYYMAKLL